MNNDASDLESSNHHQITVNGKSVSAAGLEDAKTLLSKKAKLTSVPVTLDETQQLRNKDGIIKEKSYTDVHHGTSTKQTSYVETLMNLIKGYLGCGMLAMGNAFKNGGWFCSTMFLIFFAIICSYNQYNLIWLSDELKRNLKLNNSPSFGDTIGLAFEHGSTYFKRFAKFSRKLVILCIITTQLGFCCVYFLFISDCLQRLCRMYDNDWTLDMRLALLINLPVILAIAVVRNLKYLAPLSIFANLTMLSGIAIILYNSTGNWPPISERNAFGDWSGISLFIGTAIYTFEGISLVLPLQQNMKNKDKFTGLFGILNITMTFVTLIVFLLGFTSYMKYGKEVPEVLTENLDPNYLSTKILIGSMMLGIICTYGLQFYIPVVLIVPVVARRACLPLNDLAQEYIIRLLLVLFTFFAAELIPHLDLFISLIGSIGGTLLALVLPSLAYIAIRKSDECGFLGWRVIIDIVSIGLGSVCFFLGSYFSLVAIIDSFKKDFGLV